MAKVDFSKDIYKLLGCVGESGELLEFAEWDLLKELDRRGKRKHRDVGGKRIRNWMREHRSEVNVIREKYSDELARVALL